MDSSTSNQARGPGSASLRKAVIHEEAAELRRPARSGRSGSLRHMKASAVPALPSRGVRSNLKKDIVRRRGPGWAHRITAAVVLLAGLGTAPPSLAQSADEFMANCRSEAEREQCKAFITGFMSAHILSAVIYRKKKKFCTMEKTIPEVLDGIEGYLQDHPKVAKKDMFSVVFQALSEQFPCSK